MNVEPMYLTIFLIAGGIIFLVLFFHYVPFFLWLSAKVSGVNISLVQLFLMRIRNVPPYIIVPGMIEAHKAGLKNIINPSFIQSLLLELDTKPRSSMPV